MVILELDVLGRRSPDFSVHHGSRDNHGRSAFSGCAPAWSRSLKSQGRGNDR